jgi:predicted RNA binding protein YcfA (HicA-like mRNA interferase family)
LSKLPLLTGKELGKIISKIGYEYSHSSGSHMTYINKYKSHKVTIPNHGSEKLRPGLLIKIIKKDLYLSRKEFLELLK